MTFFIYGKRTAPEHWDNFSKVMIPQDKQFRALDYKGRRTTKLTEAIPFATREDAEQWMKEKIAKRGLRDGVVWEIREKKE